MDLGLSGKVAAVAASSSGLGKAGALALAREGASVALCSRSPERLDAALEDIRARLAAEGGGEPKRAPPETHRPRSRPLAQRATGPS